MKTTIMTLGSALLMAMSTSAFAQASQASPNANPQRMQMQNMTPEQRADMEIKRLDSQLKLSDDQKSQLKTLIVNVNTQMDQNRTAAGGDRQKMMQMNQSLRQQKQDGINKILTTEQQAKYKEMQQGRPQNMQRMQPNGGAAPAPNGNQ